MSTQFHEREFFPFDLLFKNFFDQSQTFTPILDSKLNYPINIFEDPSGLTFELACTGIPKDHLEIQVDGDMIRFSYDNSKQSQVKDNKKYIYKGIAQRSFNLGYKVSAKFDLSKSKARFNDGLLTVEVPFAKNKEPKLLKID